MTSKQFMSAFWALARPYWVSRERRTGVVLLVAVVVMSLALVWLNVQFNHWYNDFYNTFQTKNQADFYHQLLKFTLLAFGYIIIGVIQQRQVTQRRCGFVADEDLVHDASSAEPPTAQVVRGVCPVADYPLVVTDGAPPADRCRCLGLQDGDGHPPPTAAMGWSASTRHRADPRVADIAGGGRPHNGG